MQQPYVNKLGFANRGFGVGSFAQGHITKNVFAQDGAKPSFQNVMMDTMGKVNTMVDQPNTMMNEAIVNGTYDVHDVMMASAKAELAITITSQIATKVVQAYDKILQIQV